MHPLTSNRYYPLFALAAIILLYSLLVFPMISHVGIAFDEQTDLSISQSYDADARGWLRGSNIDATNVRLPMYVPWLFSSMTDNPLYSARNVSCVMGMLTLLAVFLYCRREFSETTGLIACFILAISPYFLAFSKVGYTEGDSFITCFTVWLLFCIASLRKYRTLKWVAATGLCLGLALSAKASATALVAAATFSLLLPNPRPIDKFGESRLEVKRTLFILCLMTLVLIVVAGGWYFSGAAVLKDLPATYSDLSNDRLLFHYLFVLLFWSIVLVLLYMSRTRHAGHFWSLLLVLGLAAITFFVLPPVHTTNPAIITSLVGIFISSTDAFTWKFAGESAALHFLAILLKSGIVVGIGFWLSVIAAIWQWRKRPEFRTPLIFFIIYFAFLVLKMPHTQTYFMMPLLPIAAVFLADLLLRIMKRYRMIALVIIALALFTTTMDLIRTYPHTHLNGYQWLGARYLAGRSTIGYRSVVQTPSDGLEQATQWVRHNVAKGERVLYFIWADHILRANLENTGIMYANGAHPRYKLEQGNYVLIHINATIYDGRGKENPRGSVYKYNFDMEELERDFRKIYSEKRPFGIEVASVWYRKVPYDVDEKGNFLGLKTDEAGQALHPSVK